MPESHPGLAAPAGCNDECVSCLKGALVFVLHAAGATVGATAGWQWQLPTAMCGWAVPVA
eukprot:366217-Chlamydomonas_euryale.AAC.13